MVIDKYEIKYYSIPLYIANIDINKINLVNEKFEETWLSEKIVVTIFKNTLDSNSINYLPKNLAVFIIRRY